MQATKFEFVINHQSSGDWKNISVVEHRHGVQSGKRGKL
jgi:hypothetical protein